MKKVVHRNDTFCLERQKEQKRVYIPLEPQPEEGDVVTLHRYYAKHTGSLDYEKRVSYMEEGVSSGRACYEYKGVCP